MKKLLSGVLAAAMMLALCGCTAIFDKEYYVEEDYHAPAEAPADVEWEAADSILNYAGLKRAITRLVAEHAESAQLQFQNYDGPISQDISAACWEVKSSTALGAFAVDYISYDLSRIVSFYQAEIYITYKRSAYQVDALEQTENAAALSRRLDAAIRAGETYLVLGINAASATADTVRRNVQRAYYADPLACPVLPTVEVGVYPESGVSRIMEIVLDYGADSQTLADRRQELGAAVDVMAAETLPPEGEDRPSEDTVLALCRYIGGGCVCDSTAGSTAWDALAAGTADSEGMAMALEAGCRAAGVDCRVVSGRLGSEAHFWNIVTIDDGTYHVDVSNWSGGEDQVFLVSDETLWGAYWWDTSEYPACPVSFGQEPIPSEEPSEELAPMRN